MSGAADSRITVAAGQVDVLHRLALAVRPIDARTAGPVGSGPTVSREGAAGAPVRSGYGGLVLRYGTDGGVRSRAVRVRIDDPEGRWVPRRFDVQLWTRPELAEADATPPTAPYVSAGARLLRPWLLPGAAYPVPKGTTGLRFRVTAGGVPVRWARVVAFGPTGRRVGWSHGDGHGQVLLLVDGTGAEPPTPSAFQLALRIHAPDPALARPPVVSDPLADLVVEDIPRTAVPAGPADGLQEVLRGSAKPAGYLTAAEDAVVTLTVGRVLALPDQPFSAV